MKQTLTENERRISEALDNWTKIKIDGKSIDDILNISKVPLWWFYKRFITMSLLPKGLASFADMAKSIEEGKSIKTVSDVKKLMIRKGLLLNEKTKELICKFKKKEKDKFTDKILYLTYTNHINPDTGEIYRINNLIKKTNEIKNIRNFILVTDLISKNSYKKLRKLDNAIYSYINFRIKRAAKKTAKQLYKAWKSIDDETKQKLLMLDNNISLFPYIKDHLDILFSKEFIYITALYYETIKHIIKEYKIRLIVLTASMGIFEKCAIVAANDTNANSLLLQHGIGTNYRKTELNTLKNVCIAVFGEADKKRLISSGFNKNNIIITGPIVFDNITAYISKTCEDLNNILILTQPFYEDGVWTLEQRDKFFEALSVISKEFSDKNIIIKLHPREHIKDYLDYFRYFRNIEITQNNLYKNIQKSGLAIGIYSTTNSEALILNKPLVILDLYGQASYGLDMEGLALYLTNTDDIKQRILDFFEKTKTRTYQIKRDRFIEENFYKIDGKAIERVLELIISLVK